MPWPGPQQPIVEIRLPLTAEQPAPTPSYPASTGGSERFRRLEEQVHQLALTVHELNQTVTALQQQQTPARRPRRRWYQRLTVETWGDDDRA